MRRLDDARRDVREGGKRNAVRQRYLRGSVGIRHAGVADELVRIRRLVDLVDDRRVLVPLVAHVIGIDADAVTAADHGLFGEAVGHAEPRSEVLLTGRSAGIPRHAAFAAD